MTNEEITQDKEEKKVTLKEFVKDLPESQEEKAIEMIRAKKAKKLLDSDKKRLKSLNKCLVKGCNGKLIDFDVEHYLQQGRKGYRLECDKCAMMHRLSVYFREAPGLCEGEMKLTRLEFNHRAGHPAVLKDKDLEGWLEVENENVIKNRSEYQRRDEQIIIRCMYMINNKLNELRKR